LNSFFLELGATPTLNDRFLMQNHPFGNNNDLTCYYWDFAHSIYSVSQTKQQLPSSSTKHEEGAFNFESDLGPNQNATSGPQPEGIVINVSLKTAAIQLDGTWKTDQISNSKYADPILLKNIPPLTKSVGLIKVQKGKETTNLGTGWVFATKVTDNDPELIVTNKHIAKKIYSRVGSKYYKDFQLKIIIQFYEGCEIEIELLCCIGNYDIAFFTPKNTSLPDDLKALPLAPSPAMKDSVCVTLGFPFWDSRETLLINDNKKYFPDGLGIKTIAFGEVKEEKDYVYVMSYTLGGNSGSPVLNNVGQVIGLHFGAQKEGGFTVSNKAEPASVLKVAEVYARFYYNAKMKKVVKK